MHIHIVGRSPKDPAWPGVVWSHSDKQLYGQEEINAITTAWREWQAKLKGEPNH